MTQQHWMPEVQALWEKLERLQLDDDNAVFDFSARLSKENGWSREFTSRVIQEYKRFLLLAMHAGHPVTPSEAVDQVWHLHLVYTRSYWQVLCGQILGRSLHHEPTKGGAMEGGKFREQYQRTLESYRRLFGEEPPADVWTSVEHCFRPKAFRWVDVSRRWVLPKPAWITRMRPPHVMSAAMLIVMAAMLVGCDDLDVFDYRGEAFLLFYGYGFAIALVASLLLARVIAGIVSTRAKNHSLSDPYEIALLGGGARRVLDAALAALFARKMLEIQSHGSQNPATLHRVPDVMASQMHPVEEKVLNALPQDLRSLRKRFEPVAEKLRANLEAAGWMLTNSQRSQIQLITAVPLVLMMLVGLVKVFVGMDRDKPVMFLVFALVVSLIVTVVILSKVRRRTTAGDAEWKRLARPTTAPRLTSSPPLFADIGGLAAMAVAVTGVQALAGSGYESLYQTIRHPQATSSSGCGSSGCGTSGCGGGGGDSGGSGCSSGCGGCGGGGD
jgi:uncharacterized protein (TIGR04222 family)